MVSIIEQKTKYKGYEDHFTLPIDASMCSSNSMLTMIRDTRNLVASASDYRARA